MAATIHDVLERMADVQILSKMSGRAGLSDEYLIHLDEFLWGG